MEDAEQTFTSFSSWFSKALWRSDIESNELMKQMKFRGKSCKVPARPHASLIDFSAEFADDCLIELILEPIERIKLVRSN